jgi:hypothetical protein
MDNQPSLLLPSLAALSSLGPSQGQYRVHPFGPMLHQIHGNTQIAMTPVVPGKKGCGCGCASCQQKH